MDNWASRWNGNCWVTEPAPLVPQAISDMINDAINREVERVTIVDSEEIKGSIFNITDRRMSSWLYDKLFGNIMSLPERITDSSIEKKEVDVDDRVIRISVVGGKKFKITVSEDND